MVEVDFSGDYMNVENTNENDIVTIISEAQYVDITLKNGEIKKVLNIPVDVNGHVKVYTPSREVGKLIVKAFGKETKNWIGKQLVAHIVNYKSFGETKQTIDCKPLVSEKA